MPDYPIIENVGETLINLLWTNMQKDNRIKEIIETREHINLTSPADLESNDAPRLSLYLYRITENSFMKNNEMLINNNDPKKKGRMPMTLDLFYLITPNTENQKKDHRLLGKVMQIFHDHAVIRGSLLHGIALKGTAEELRVVFYSLPFEEIIQLWQSFSDKPFRLSICYQVTAIKIDSTLELKTKRVVEKEDSSYQKPGEEKNRRENNA